MKIFKTLIFLLVVSFLYPLTIITGKVINEQGEPIIYANVYLKDTFDGSSSDEHGEFQFETYETGLQTLVVSYVGYESYKVEHNVDTIYSFEIILKELVTQANEVVITAGSFGASDDEKVIVLDPVDIVSVASSRGEISGALEALPGTQPQADKEGIYVRGGDASEAKQIIDGMLVQNPYFSDVPDIPQRGRFEPFDFQGTAFSQGGYSAQYGQALSSIVDLQTWSRFGDFNAYTFGITPIGTRIGRGYGNDSMVCNLEFEYGNHKFFDDFNNNGFLSNFIKKRTKLLSAPEGKGVRTSYSKKFDKGIYKYIGKYTEYSLQTGDADVGINFDLDNEISYLLTTYKGSINKKWNIQLGLSYSDNKSNAKMSIPIPEDLIDIINNGDPDTSFLANAYDDLLQFRSILSRKIFSKSKIKLGFHLFDQSSSFYNYIFKEETINRNNQNNNTSVTFNGINESLTGIVSFKEFLTTAFAELDLRLSKKFALNTGVRYEQSKLIHKTSISPRFSMAYKINKNSQSSYAYGKYFQTPELGFDQWYRRHNINFNSFDNKTLKFERSEHHILNYEWSKKKKTLRLEIFEKEYSNLITLHGMNCSNNVCPNTLLNTGEGYSRGFEMFWRYDQKNNEGVGQDIFFTYSYLDSKRTFKEYLIEITPSFASKNKITFSYNNTFYLKDGKSRFSSSLALTGTSGFPYYDPYNNIQHESTPYFSLDVGGSYLPNIENGFLVLFFNISNPLGYHNSFGYEYTGYDYAALPEPIERLPQSLRSVFVGCFMFFSINKDK